MTFLAHRLSKKELIAGFFYANLGHRYDSAWLHLKFGTAVRTRISEINRDPKALITIRNEGVWDANRRQETSDYWSELRPVPVAQQNSLFAEAS